MTAVLEGGEWSAARSGRTLPSGKTRPLPSAEFKERVQLYLLVPSVPPPARYRKTSTFFFLWRCCPTRAMAYSCMRFLDHTRRRITVGWTPLDERLACRTDLYLTKHNSQEKDSHTTGGIRTHNSSKRAAADLSLRPRDHRDLHLRFYMSLKHFNKVSSKAD